jgi:D-alanine-D-alanine ligase-like ATP-grasp enzyme
MNVTKYIEQITSERKQKFFKEALSLGIDIKIVSQKHKLTKFSFGDNFFFALNDVISFNTKTTAQITRNKNITKLILAQNNISVPRGIETDNVDDVKNAINDKLINYPLVIKPIDAAKGVGINMNVFNLNDIKNAVQNIQTIKKDVTLMVSDNFIAEEQFSGNDYRILVFNNKIIGCVNRIPAFVVGDGINTIAKLIENFNAKRPSNYLLKIDKSLIKILKEKSYSLDTILPKNKKLILRQNANISSGGVAVDYTDTMSERFKKICLSAANAVRGVFVGIDLFTDDITSKNIDQPYTIIEINGAPDYDVHESPIVPESTINIPKILLQYFFKDLK